MEQNIFFKIKVFIDRDNLNPISYLNPVKLKARVTNFRPTHFTFRHLMLADILQPDCSHSQPTRQKNNYFCQSFFQHLTWLCTALRDQAIIGRRTTVWSVVSPLVVQLHWKHTPRSPRWSCASSCKYAGRRWRPVWPAYTTLPSAVDSDSESSVSLLRRGEGQEWDTKVKRCAMHRPSWKQGMLQHVLSSSLQLRTPEESINLCVYACYWLMWPPRLMFVC